MKKLLVMASSFLVLGCSTALKIETTKFELLGRKCEAAQAKEWNTNDLTAACDDKGELKTLSWTRNRPTGETVGQYSQLLLMGVAIPWLAGALEKAGQTKVDIPTAP